MAEADAKLFLWINSWVGRFPVFDQAMEWIVSDYLIPVSFALVLLCLWFTGSDKLERQRHQIGVFVALSSMGFASLAVFIINALYFRPRPFAEHEVSLLFYKPTDSSFPANSMAATFAIAAAVFGVNRRVGAVMYIVAAIYAFSRVYAGVHYPLDVTAGALIGIVVAWLVFKLRDLLEPLPTLVIKAFRIICLA